MDLRLSRYDRIAARFQSRQIEALNVLKKGIKTNNKAFNHLIEEIERVAVNTIKPILLLGPSGAGKSELARRIYDLRKERGLVSGKFIEVDCGTIRGDRAMSDLFGHVKGAFTGATGNRLGFVRAAHKGLLFLDEISNLGLKEQTMLLRAIETKHFSPVGTEAMVESDFQLITATNLDPKAAVRSGTFRADLQARIDFWPYELPGLRDRMEDIEPNLDYELDRWARENGKRVRMSTEVRMRFLQFATSPEAKWRANFRDLIKIVERMATLAENGVITIVVLENEINRLLQEWAQEDPGDSDYAMLTSLLGQEGVAKLDLFDRIQLSGVIRVCRDSDSAATAGKRLFAASRHEKFNDSDRVAKYLRRFNLRFSNCKAIGAGSGI